MASVTVYLAPPETAFRGITLDVHVPDIIKALPNYKLAVTFESQLEGVSAAEEAFDVSNNPSRDDRWDLYGPHRSVSTGDVIEVDGEKFICMSSGWRKI